MELPVNIPDLPQHRLDDGVTQKDTQVVIWLWRSMHEKPVLTGKSVRA